VCCLFCYLLHSRFFKGKVKSFFGGFYCYLSVFFKQCFLGCFQLHQPWFVFTFTHKPAYLHCYCSCLHSFSIRLYFLNQSLPNSIPHEHPMDAKYFHDPPTFRDTNRFQILLCYVISNSTGFRGAQRAPTEGPPPCSYV